MMLRQLKFEHRQTQCAQFARTIRSISYTPIGVVTRYSDKNITVHELYTSWFKRVFRATEWHVNDNIL